MKRVVVLVLCAVLACASIPLSVGAESASVTEEHFEDGSCIIEYVVESAERSSGTKTAKKVRSFRNSEGDIEWTITLTAKFSYDGSSAKAMDTDVSVSIFDSVWNLEHKYVVRSSNTATAKVTLNKSILGIEVDSQTYTVTLTCSPDGTIA